MQHQLTLVKIRPTNTCQAYVRGLLLGEVRAELEQKQNPWLLYWCQWYDPWSMTGQLASELSLKEKADGVYEVMDPISVKEFVKVRLRKKYQWKEVSWLHHRILEAITAYEGLCPARIILHDKCTGSSLEDSELFK